VLLGEGGEVGCGDGLRLPGEELQRVGGAEDAHVPCERVRHLGGGLEAHHQAEAQVVLEVRESPGVDDALRDEGDGVGDGLLDRRAVLLSS
jgi:hypothetical protein